MVIWVCQDVFCLVLSLKGSVYLLPWRHGSHCNVATAVHTILYVGCRALIMASPLEDTRLQRDGRADSALCLPDRCGDPDRFECYAVRNQQLGVKAQQDSYLNDTACKSICAADFRFLALKEQWQPCCVVKVAVTQICHQIQPTYEWVNLTEVITNN